MHASWKTSKCLNGLTVRSLILASALLASSLASILFPKSSWANERPWRPGTLIRYATVTEGAEILATNDRFLAALSRFDRQIRLQVAGEPTLDEFRRYVRSHVSAWSPEEIERVNGCLDRLSERLGTLAPPWPDRILLIKTTGKEEGGAAYCRGTAVIIPQTMLDRPSFDLDRLLLHEFFHILSNHQPELVRSFYPLVGFEPCEEIVLPAQLAPRKITNPDAPSVNCVMQLEINGVARHVAPVLLATVESFDPKAGGSLFRYLSLKLMVVEKSNDTWQVATEDGEPLLLDPKDYPQYEIKTGRNTKYILHPEELLADNFVHLVFETPGLSSPRIVDSMRSELRKFSKDNSQP